MSRKSLIFCLLLVLFIANMALAGPRSGSMSQFDCQFATAELRKAGHTDLTVTEGTFEIAGPQATSVLYLHAQCVSTKGGIAFATLKCEGDPHSPTCSIIKLERR